MGGGIGIGYRSGEWLLLRERLGNVKEREERLTERERVETDDVPGITTTGTRGIGV